MRALRRWFLSAVSAVVLVTLPGFLFAQEAAHPIKKGAALKIAFFQLEAQGVEPKVSSIVTDMLLLEMSKMQDAKVIGSKEIDAMLGYEQKKQISGCTDTSCMVAIGGALGVDKILMGSVGKLGTSYMLNLKLINISSASIEQMYGKRLKGGNEEEFLDIIPEALGFIFPASAYVWAKDIAAGGRGAAQPPPKTGASAPVPVEVVDLQRTPGQMKAPEGKRVEVSDQTIIVKKGDKVVTVDKKHGEVRVEVKADDGSTKTTVVKQGPSESQAAAGKSDAAVVKAESAPSPPAGPYSHSSQFFLGAKGILQVQYLTYAGEVHLGYGLGDWVELGAAVIVSKDLGFKPRATFFVYNPDGALKPYIGVQVPYYKGAGGAVVSAGAASGLQWDFHRMAGLNVEFAAEYVVVKPSGSPVEALNLMGLLGVQGRL